MHWTTSPRSQDPLGKQIQSQTFTFDALDNFTEVTTVFAEGSNTAQYEYSDDDPTQLRVISNNHKDYPERLELDYDANGNLTMDEAGRTIKYDALGRLLSVSATADIPAVDYGYDALDSLTNSRSTDGSEQRFYRDGQLANQLRGEEQRSFSRAGDQLLAEHQGGNNAGTQLLATDARKTVLAEVSPQSINDLSYSAYGHQSSAVAAASRSGFNGELRESATGWYLLGQGYRAYNPVLMRFHSPDSLSPFGDGGLNAYAYCVGDPVNYLDPDGHIPWWLGLAVGIGVTVLTAGVAAPFAAAFGAGAATVSAFTVVGSVTGGVSTVIGVGSAVGSALTKGDVSEMLGWASVWAGVLGGVMGGLGLGIKAGAWAASTASRAGSSASTAASSALRTLPEEVELAVTSPGRGLPGNEFVTTSTLTNARNTRLAAVPEIPPEFPAAAPAKPFSLEKFYRKNPAHMRAVIARNSGYDAAKIRSNHGRPGDWDKFFQW
ncbi:hypothetical protein AO067_18895 [Pseudomonas viridiflava ICMP 13104]|uniref:Teneurin-like YD-shell domain-containing protein n=1 Tax=Pseudomonas viridiflava ICMP 13104 TaxID=1198305 RepID=A0A0W0H0W7_PSEVI|nr:hypothetical protein AO067_18895 [Pseudomonas viridiflava ICMP 13104]